MDGLLLIDKPKGWTSFDVVAKIRGILRTSGIPKPKVGHTGTLDPLATGLVVVTLGSYCKRAQDLSKLDKTYRVTAQLGQTSSTGDEEGEKTPVSNKKPTLATVQEAIKQFTGPIQQTPPAFSAIKINGKRAYQLARQGKEVKIEPRKVTIYGYEGIEYAYPKLMFTVEVSSGTYIRSLVEDIGKELATGAYTTNLHRLKVGQFAVIDALPVASLDAETVYQNIQTKL